MEIISGDLLLENQFFCVRIALHGAELKSLKSKESGREYVYDGSAGWKRSSPVLFPNIGGLAGAHLVYNQTTYPAPAHGFARDMDFELVEHQSDFVKLRLNSNKLTKQYYPFDFCLDISYSLKVNGIQVSWTVTNLGDAPMYFSIGAHPGFMLLPNTQLSDYKIEFDRKTDIETRRVEGRYLTENKELLFTDAKGLNLKPSLLEKDAIILEDTNIQSISLVNQEKQYCIKVIFPNFPVVAIWTDTHEIRQAKFICIEPWCGINSLVGDNEEDISLKSRVTKLDEKCEFNRTYIIEIVE